MTIHMVWDKLHSDWYQHQNMLQCHDLVPSHDDRQDLGRFVTTGITRWLRHYGYDLVDHQLPSMPQRFVYATGTHLGPEHWSGWPNNPHGFASLFDHIPQPVLQAMVDGRALLLIDQLMEGYTDDRLWTWFHSEMSARGLPAGSVIYYSGNCHERQRYAKWCQTQGQQSLVTVGSLPHLEFVCQTQFANQRTTNWRQRLLRNAARDHIALYCCLNRAQRYHRNVMYMELCHADLLQHGLISMERLDWDWSLEYRWGPSAVAAAKSQLPLLLDRQEFVSNPAFAINTQIYDAVHISLVTETLADDEPDSLFVTEKVFKCIHQSHPFMVLGQRGHLAQLRAWGYETFDDCWDESYDQLQQMEDRASSIAGQLRHLASSRDLAETMERTRSAVQHNLELFLRSRSRAAEVHALGDPLLAHMRGN